jgi:hypothetical protein
VFLLSLDGQPDGFIAGFGFDDLLFEFVEPFARFQDLAYQLVATYEDAALGILGGVAHVDADTLEEVVESGTTEWRRYAQMSLRERLTVIR